MIDLLLELLMNRLGIFILGIAVIVGGVYVWLNFRTEARLYDAAAGPEGRSAAARVVWKNRESVRSDYAENDTTVDYFKLEYEFEGEEIDAKIYVEPAEYARYKEGDTIDIRFSPNSKQIVFTPASKRPSTLFASGMAIFLIILGSLIVIAVIVSFL